MNTNTQRQHSQRFIARFFALTIGALCVSMTPASAQVSAVDEPYVVVVESDAAPMRCGADELYYEVGAVAQGTKLLVDASDAFGINGDGWLRVSFPSEQPALIKALPEHLDVDTMRGTVTLLRPSRLVALSVDGDLSQSWKKLLAKPMEPGSTMKILETIRDENGEPLAYLVPAPKTARGFIHGRFVRQATSSESLAYFAGDNEMEMETEAIAAAPEQETEIVIPDPIAEPQQEAARAMTEPVENDEPVETVATNEPQNDVAALLGVGSDPVDETPTAEVEQTHAARPINVPVVQNREITTVAGADEEDDFGSSSRGADSDDELDEEPVVAEPIIENRPLPSMRDLESAYAAVLAQKASMAEVDPLIGEHERYLAAMDKGEASGDDLDREVLVAHLELLKIRADLQKSMLRIEGVREQAEQSIVRINEGFDGIDRSSEYVVVGRLTTSVVYDGKRLPLLYRVQSIDENSGRTLAYVVPVKGLDLSGSLGSIVGVAGSARVDASSRLNIVTPGRIDRLQSTASAQ